MSTGDHLSPPSECKFELNEYDEVCDTGGEHAGEGTASDEEHPTPRDRLRVIDYVHHLLDISSVLWCQLAVLESEKANALETSVKSVNFKIEHFKVNEKSE